MKKLEKKQLIVVAFTFALLLLIGGTYAYFSINATSDKTGAKVTGKANNLGNPTMQIKTSKLYLNLDANLMSQANAGKTYYANEDESGLARTTNPNYVLAVAQLPESDEALDCTYNYKVTATVTKEITDNSDSNVVVTVGNKTMTLKELTTAGTNGIIVSGEIKNLTKGQSVSIPLTSSVTNTANTQDNLVGNSYTIKIEPYNNGDTKAFSCKLRYKIDTTKTFAQNLIDSDWLWQSGLEGDGYRYAGTGLKCSYDNGNYTLYAYECPTLYNYTVTRAPLDLTGDVMYEKSCPSDNEYFSYSSCTELNAIPDYSNIPNNFICFGTTDKTKCTANQDKYMYRVIGVFSDANGENHVKLIKYKQLGSTYKWHADSSTDVAWENSDMYNGLNGSYFLTNTTWSNRIENWTWSAVNTKTYDGGPDYHTITTQELYLHEMNRSAKTSTVGEWTTPSAKIGLMYASDYTLSLGASALAITGSIYDNRDTLKTGWMRPSNNDTTKTNYEWILSRFGVRSGFFSAWDIIDDEGRVFHADVNNADAVRPVFYLTTDTKVSSGDGSLENPFILE